MTNFSKLFGKIKQHSLNYLKTKTSSLSPSQRRCVNEIFYGLFESGNVTLSDIARSLNEEIKIEKTINRLSKNLSKEDLLIMTILCLSAYVHQDPRMALLLKAYGPHMESWCMTQMLTKDKTQVSEQWAGGMTVF